MAEKQARRFGGDWTQEKLDMLQQYLHAYTTALKNTHFELTYIDAFAGTGYREHREKEHESDLLFLDIVQEEPQRFLAGSAIIALRNEPAFSKYVFVERSRNQFEQLLRLKEEFPERAPRMQLVQEDCNTFIRRFCAEKNWSKSRAVLFLDPFGMQVEWETMRAIARTQAIDAWILFPLGIGVNRLLKRDGDIPPSWRSRLDRVFGTQDWYKAFYVKQTAPDLFGGLVESVHKVCDFDSIREYIIRRFRTIFADVAKNSRYMYNSAGNPMFLFCFAVSNPKGARVAIRIAEHILRG